MPYVLILLITLVSCASPKVKSDFEPYIKEFESTFNTKVYTKVEFNNYSHSNLIGFCDPWSNLVFIDRTYWKYSGHYKKRSLMFHELGHCHFLFLHHDDRKDERGCYKSIMASNMDDESCIVNNWDKQIERFRKRRQ